MIVSKSEGFDADKVEQKRPLEEAAEYHPTNNPSIVAEEHIQLLEERLVVNLQRRKVGEVIVRKEIETRIVEVPIRRERLVVEQVSPEAKQLAVIDLGQIQDAEFDTLRASGNMLSPTVEGRFTSVHAAIQFLQAISAQSSTDLQSVQVILTLEDTSSQAMYQSWLEDSAHNQPL